ncbi:MAG: hypothetical protein ACOCZ5_03650 [bacterium]
MKIRNFYLTWMVMMLFVMSGMISCAGKTPIQTGILVTDSYIALHDEYLQVYDGVDEETQEKMKGNIAPKMNRLKAEIIDYNEMVLAGEDAEKQREMIIDKLREISIEIAGVE